MKNTFYLFLILIFSCKLSAQELYFPPIIGNEWETVSPTDLNWCDTELTELQTWLGDNNTKAFMILKDGKIAVEWYYDDFTQDSVWYWASAGKTMTAFLTGIAQEKGYLDINDKTSDYLGDGWTSAPLEKEHLITIKNQLSMTVGLDDGVSDIHCTDANCLNYLTDAGTRWAYHNGAYTLLSHVIESAIAPNYSSNYNNFTFSELTSKTGITGSWIYSGYNRIFFSKARSMARFGLLNLNEGTWDDTVVLSDTNYFNDMITPSQNLNNSYGYLWWLNGQDSYMLPSLQNIINVSIAPDAPSDMYAAIGKNGQLINISPSDNIVVVRMGNNSETSLVSLGFQNDMWTRINSVMCSSTSLENIEEEIAFYPNPVNNIITLKTNKNISEIKLFSLDGRQLDFNQNNNQLDVAHLTEGIYFIKIIENDREKIMRFVKL